jgi:archaemetzincin
MNRLQLLPVGKIDGGLLNDIAPALAEMFHIPSEVLSSGLNPAFALHGERQQYHSSQILHKMQGHVTDESWRVLGISDHDLYIPILTFVFGEAQIGGPCAVVSTHRLRQDFYGLPPDRELLCERLLKEAVHEIGHTLELTHCDDYQCAMAASHAVEWIDLKGSSLCEECERKLFPGARRQSAAY